jgi:hypothetical protein
MAPVSASSFRGPSLPVRRGDGPQVALDAVGHPLRRDRALQERGLDAGAPDAVPDVPDVHVDQRLGHVDQPAGAAVLELVRHLVVGVEPGRHDDGDGG